MVPRAGCDICHSQHVSILQWVNEYLSQSDQTPKQLPDYLYANACLLTIETHVNHWLENSQGLNIGMECSTPESL